MSYYVWKTICLQIDQAIRRKLTIYCQRELVLAFYIPLEVSRRFGEHLYQDMEFHLDEMKLHAVIMDARSKIQFLLNTKLRQNLCFVVWVLRFYVKHFLYLITI